MGGDQESRRTSAEGGRVIRDVAVTIPGVQAVADGELQPLRNYLHLLTLGPLQDLVKCRYLTESSCNSELPSVAVLVAVETKVFLAGQLNFKDAARHQRLPNRA